MDKFWAWMDENWYGGMNEDGSTYLCGHGEQDDEIYDNPSKQMLIGYLMEYTEYNKIGGKRIVNPDDYTDTMYNFLVDQIERHDKEK